MLIAATVARYLRSYVENYRAEYDRLTAQPPTGADYPRIPISPYLDARILKAFVVTDGAAVAVFEDIPDGTQPTAAGVVSQLPAGATPSDLWGPDGPAIWAGMLPSPVETASERVGGTDIQIARYEITLADLATRLTFGGLTDLARKFPDPSTAFWDPILVRHMCFGTSDRPYQRAFRYLEFLFHVDPAAWDSRSNWVRAHVDIGRDYVSTLEDARKPGRPGKISLTTALDPRVPRFNRILKTFGAALAGFQRLLETETSELVFHDYFARHPMLLDISGRVESNPRFPYPPGQELHDKSYVELDFMVIEPNNSYRLIELESPDKIVETRKGHPRSELTQPAFQIAEWRHYILEHYDVIRGLYPGINVLPKTTIIIGRGRFESPTERKERDQIRITYDVNEVLSYDELFDRAVETYRRLRSMTLVIPT